MKGNMKSFICGMLVMGVISCAGAYATDVWQNINVLPNTIKVVVDGKAVQADNFLYNDTTYLPIRAVSEALGKDVQYDTQTSTATISEKKEVDNMDGLYYATTRYIHNYTAWDFDTDTENLIIEDRNGDKHSFKAVAIEGHTCIPYDQFVDEIQPLLK